MRTLSYGNHTLTFNLWNAYNNTIQKSLFINPLPTITLLHPSNNVEISGSTYFLFNVDDDSPVNCSLILNGEIKQRYYNVLGNLTFSEKYPTGNYMWYVSCVDEYGGEANSEERHFTIVPEVYTPHIVIVNITEVLGNYTTKKNVTTEISNETYENLTTEGNISKIRILSKKEIIEKDDNIELSQENE